VPHIVHDFDWGVIDIIVHEKRIFFQQRWRYTWEKTAGQTDWDLDQKRKFHTEVDKQIWASWSNRVKLSVTGTSDFAKKFATTKLPMNLDIRWVLRDEHWDVTAVKNDPADMPHNYVQWDARKIKLHTSKLKSYSACTNGSPKVCTAGFKSVPHEAGHAFGNSSTLGRGDEYASTSPHLADTGSILNIGTELRKRHFRTILEEMNKMIPDTTFAVHQV